jgi:hypothetical protein
MLENNITQNKGGSNGHQRRTLEIESREYEWTKQLISGAELRKLAGISEQDEIIMMLEKPHEDEVILNESQVDLSKPGIEHFRVRKKGEDILVSIKVNDQPYSIKRAPHKVAELKKLAGVPLTDQLSELVKGKLVELQDQRTIAIKGGEEFFSCKREGSSS